MFVKKRVFLIFFAFQLLFSFTLMADVTILKDGNFAQGATLIGATPNDTQKYSNLYTEVNISGGKTESTTGAHRIYIPFKKPTPTDNINDAHKSIYPQLFVLDYSFQITINLYFTGGDQNNVYIAVKNKQAGDVESYEGYRVANKDRKGIPISNRLITLNMQDVHNNGITPSLKLENASNVDTQVMFLYIFTSNDTPLEGVIDPSKYKGTYVALHFSSVYAKIQPTLTTDIGDGRLSLKYSLNDSQKVFQGENFLYAKAMLFQSSTAIGGIEPYYNEIISQIPYEEKDLKENSSYGFATLKDLVNGVEYYPSVAVVNRYGFITKFSEIKATTPLSIQMFINKSACFLLSASFQQEHYVLNYFRNIRDNYLFKTRLGAAFVEWYYEWAPQYAPYIVKSPWLAFTIRVMAYGVYYILNYFFIGLLALLIATLFYKLYNRKRTNKVYF